MPGSKSGNDMLQKVYSLFVTNYQDIKQVAEIFIQPQQRVG